MLFEKWLVGEIMAYIFADQETKQQIIKIVEKRLNRKTETTIRNKR